MIWLAGALGYAFAVWLFLRFFQFIAEIDRDAERLHEGRQ